MTTVVKLTSQRISDTENVLADWVENTGAAALGTKYESVPGRTGTYRNLVRDFVVLSATSQRRLRSIPGAAMAGPWHCH